VLDRARLPFRSRLRPLEACRSSEFLAAPWAVSSDVILLSIVLDADE